MPLQDTTRVVMSALGVAGNVPPNAFQPALPDGVHTRWAVDQSLGFPWYGFFLFRRLHLHGTPLCLSAGLGSVPVGQMSVAFLHTANGDISSDVNLLVTDDFSPLGIPEFDLSARQFVKVALPAGELARRVTVTVGFRKVPGVTLIPVVVDFRGRANATFDNPYTEQGAVFTAVSSGTPAADNFIVQAATDAGPVSGLDCQTKLQIDLPRPSSFVEVSVTSIGTPTSVVGYNAAGQIKGVATINAAHHQTTVRFTSGPLTRVVITSSSQGAVLHYTSYERAATLSTASVTAFLGGVPVLQTTLSGDPGQIASLDLRFDAIDAVQVGTANGVLVDVCYVTVGSDATTGWSLVPGFPNPMRLPVTHPNYPPGASAVNEPAAEALALSRVRYGPPSAWAGPDAFGQLHDNLLLPLVQDGPSGIPMAERTQQVTAIPPSSDAPRMTAQRPLDFVLLGSLNPAVAQMLGLYWVDSTVTASNTYDYMLVADHTGVGGLSSATVLSQIQSAGFATLDAWISYHLRRAPVPAATPPQNVRSYALPGATRLAADGTTNEDASNNAGLSWDLLLVQGFLLPGAPIMFHIWRADLGNSAAAPPSPPGSAYALRTADSPVLLPKLNGAAAPQRSSSWPPFRLHIIDQALPEGWYAYQVNGIDIFGLHSANSVPAVWYQWTPAPDPPPWYYVGSQGAVAVHPHAVRLLDKIAPSSPTAVDATALDPADPLLLRDAPYNSWFASLSPGERESVIGLRVSWKWTIQQQAQAPDTHEFRIYYQPGKLNTLGGRVTSVTPATSTDTDVQTDIPSTAPAGGYVGGALRMGSQSFLILSSDAGTPLRLRVRNVGPTQSDIPQANKPCTVAIPSVVSLGTASVVQGSATVTGSGTSWTAALVGQPFQLIGDLTRYKVAAVSSSTQLTLDRAYGSASAPGQGYAIDCPLFVDFGESVTWQERYYIVDYGAFVTVQGDGTRFYEVLIPAVGDVHRSGLEKPGRAFVPSPAEPLVYGYVGVSAADMRPHTPDDPRWASGDYGNRVGNEGRVSAPAAIYRVLRTPPPAPVVFAEPERVYASPADYHSASFYTYRWRPSANLKTHVSRALDGALFRADWTQRPRPDPTSQDFPDESIDPRWNAAKRAEVIAALDELNTPPYGAANFALALLRYRALSDDALRILAGLRGNPSSVPGNEPAFSLLTIQPLDSTDPVTADRPGPDAEPGYVPSTEKRAYIDTLDGRASNRYFYRAAYVDGASNVSPLGLSSPPVYLRKVVPPRRPVITKVWGGDRVINLRWTPNRETDLASYRVYRADTAEAARDIRLMTKIHDGLIAPQGPPDPYEIVLSDDDPPFQIDRYYVLTATDTVGNESPPSKSVIGRAYDDAHPDPPDWNPAVPGSGSDLVLSWTSAEPFLMCLVQRSLAGAGQWATFGGWQPRGSYTLDDTTRADSTQYDYRVLVLDEQGRRNTVFNILTA